MQNGRPLVVVANRLPISKETDHWRASSGGLVTALRPATDEYRGAWIGWDGGASDVPSRAPGLDIELHPVSLTEEQAEGYYFGFANRTLWPLFHDLVAKPSFDRRWWRLYQDVNHQFAEVAAQLDTSGGPPIFWVHDYHQLLLPGLLRGIHPASPIGFFLHIPFPPPELMAQLPWREQLLAGMLGAGVIGFHTSRYRDNFMRSCQRVFGDVRLAEGAVRAPDGRTVRVVAHPISIDVDEFSRVAVSATTTTELAELQQQFDGRRVFLGVDRLDYTKGIRHRLQAIEILLERRADLRDRVTFVQIAVPSRDDVEEYQTLRTEIEGEVGRINGRFTEPGQDVPVHYLYRSVSSDRLAAYYRLADVMCVTPLKDGMNLVAKEFVACQAAGGEAGVLLLSEFAGAAAELREAVPCNPFDVEGLSIRMEEALERGTEENRAALATMAAVIAKSDVFNWTQKQLDAIAAAPEAAR